MLKSSDLAELLKSSLHETEVTADLQEYLVSLGTKGWFDEKRSRADIDSAAQDLIDRQLEQKSAD